MSKLRFEWKRPQDFPYPTVWQTFKDLDLDSDNEVEYCIQDLPETRFDDAINHMTEYYLPDEPVAQSIHCAHEQDFIEDWQNAWRIVLEQKMSIVCFKEDSDEIVGMNLTFVVCKDDNIMEYIKETSKSYNTARFWGIFDKLHHRQVIDPFKKYGVDKYLSSLGLSVTPKYRGRGIGEKILRTRKVLGQAFGLKLTHNGFSNDISSKIADRVGFKLDGEIYYDDLAKNNPQYCFPDCKSKKATMKTWVF